MSEMVERVAKAAYSSLFVDGDEWPNVSSSVSAEQFRDAARAAIEAMREPTALMLLEVDIPVGDYFSPKECWQAMIDEALK